MGVHSGYYREATAVPAPPVEKREVVLSIMEEQYKLATWTLPDDYLSRAAFDRAIDRVDRSSSPGYPFCIQAGTNGDWLGWDGFQYDSARVDYLWRMVLDLIRFDEDLYLRVFVKREPHDLAKIREGRWRLIMASPLHVQILWHMLFDLQNDKEIARSYDIPSQQGMVLCYGGWKQYLRQWQAIGYDSGFDKRAWDWTMAPFLFDWELEFRYRQMRTTSTLLAVEWRALAQRMYNKMFADCLVITSDGTVFRQLYPGIQKSGCVNTISTNSHAQIMIHILVRLDLGLGIYPIPRAVGDDTLEKLDYRVSISDYRKYGIIVKSCSSGIEFVGHEFFSDGPRPLYLEKHLSRLLYAKDEHLAEILDAMCRMYCKVPQVFEMWTRLACRLGVQESIKSASYYNAWYDFPEW